MYVFVPRYPVSDTSCSKFNSPPLVFVGLCPDWDQWDQTKPVDNAREAMQQADDWLGIPQVKQMHSSFKLPNKRETQ